jgi:ABC-type hemin transport system substrate-binding protein
MLSPAGAVLLRDLGLDDRMVARHAFDAASPQGLPSVGDQAGIDYEALLATNPTHVVTQWGSRELPPRLRALAKQGSTASGIALHDMNPISLAGVRSELRALQAFVGDAASQPKADALDAALHAMEEASTRALQAERARETGATAQAGMTGEAAPRVVLLLSVSPAAVLGPASAQAEVARAAGFVVVPAGAGAYAELSAEELAGLRPQAVVLFAPAVATGDEASQAKTLDELTARTRAQLQTLGVVGGVTPVPLLIVRDVESLLPSTSALRLHETLRAWRVQSMTGSDE